MECLYINLNTQADRRSFLEKNFAEHCKSGWNLARIEASSVNDVAEREVLGSLRDTEKACFLSHKAALEASLEIEGPVLILEDDAQFGAHSCTIIDKIMAALPEDNWDILYTDIGIGNVHQMLDLMMMRRRAEASDEFKVLDVANIFYFAATAYIVSPRAKVKILSYLEEERVVDMPFDLLLRKYITQKRVKGHVIFPFPTTTSSYSVQSQVQDSATALTDFIVDMFRKVSWHDRDLEGFIPDSALMEKVLDDPEIRAYATILGTMMSSAFQTK